MECKKCRGQLEVLRKCRKIRLQCKECGREYHVHEVADQLDAEAEAMLASYTAIIYD